MILIKILILTLIGFLAYDTVNFVLESERKPQTHLEVRPDYEAARVVPVPDDVVEEDDMYLGAGFLAFLTGVAGLVVMYVSKLKLFNKKEEPNALALRRVSEQPFMKYFYQVGEDDVKDDPLLMQKFSEIELKLAPLTANQDEEDEDQDAEDRFRKRCADEFDDGKIDDDNEDDEDDGMDGIIDMHLLSNNTSMSVQNTLRRDATLTQTESSVNCDCNLEQFEERLGAVEHGLKTSSEATKEWSKRIEQAEVDLVNLHRQMYTILSKAEFIAPSSDVFSKTAGEMTPTDFYDSTLYKVPDIIVETKKELEQGDLFRKSLTKLSTDDNWSAVMEEELTDKIKELTSASRSHAQPQTASTATTDPIKIKESLLRKNEELKEKTRGIVRAMEDAVRATAARKGKLSVHSHYVAPYRRIQHADTDHFNPMPKSKTQS